MEVHPEREATWTYHRYLSGALANSLSQRLDVTFKTFKNVEQRLTLNEDLHFLYVYSQKKTKCSVTLYRKFPVGNLYILRHYMHFGVQKDLGAC